ncbi:hypothetical protein [Verminephrobacter eiseniae]|uniref:Flagellar protein FlgN n=1 Tax=Verminephrobacter eiseniae (strain EF01-2) TaxID=391735 RepID=A1WFE9_VEREI|nr:hypothetical protein [Verminephrobacter eiseniae]ABM56356.1 hypothetical protein Veis_0572 [Verminephrobacter eiseniae EF01-2]MCW5286719.1 hypothetical protein [Verminephrobacter eiseniae]MCW5305016.1 hypothetical protein [Verminephrobacter eiseniae]MCW8192560.1 hypothetical protein [Verminephrobacter eiseniae]
MSPQESLQAVEQLLDQVSAALLAADPSAVEKHGQALRDAAARCAQLLGHMAASRRGHSAAPWQPRIVAISHRLRLQREGLARLAALAERQLAGLLPPGTAAPTYGAGPGAAAKPTLARIYHGAS